MQSIVAFSHLRWDSVYQRPQHLFTRLVKHWRVVMMEEPVTSAGRDALEVFEPAPGVLVFRPHVRGAAPGFHDDHLATLQSLLADGLREHGVAESWLWYYTPMALPLGNSIEARGIVYDCIDDLSLRAQAPRQLLHRENQLFKVADMVFTAAPGLYNARRQRHPDVHCFPNSVDAAHFSSPRPDHPLHAGIPHPRIGYSGMIDERINLALIDAIARDRPEWNIVLVGPHANDGLSTLARRDNVHWLGLQPYDDLPALVANWDVCLLPYALDEATRFICPTKTLEYMACGKPVVSTSIRDVVETYGQAVRIADTPEGFIADCEMLMQRSAEERGAHARELAAIVARTSWDKTAEEMATLVTQADELADVVPLPRSDQRLGVPAFGPENRATVQPSF